MDIITALMQMELFRNVLQVVMDESYRALFLLLISLGGGLLGVPLIQFLKTQYNLKDKGAMALAAAMAAVIGISELLLSHQLDILTITIDNFPYVFGMIYTTSNVYYRIFKGVEGVLGDSFMIRKE